MNRETLLAIGVELLVACTAQTPLAEGSLPIATIAAMPDPSMTPFQPANPTDTTFPLSVPEPIPTPTFTPEPSPQEEPMPTNEPPDSLIITIVYNNIPDDPRLTTDWGFGAYIEYHGQVVLFDTGTDGQILLQNMHTLALDPQHVQSVVLSHVHNDHTGGLLSFLDVSAHPPVFLLSSFGPTFIEQTRRATEVIETTAGQVIAENILTTGEVSGRIPEQALLIRTDRGLVVMTGCAHPGILRIVERAVELTGSPVYLVMGGFHLGEASQAEVASVLAGFRRLGVQHVAPSHCTGDLAIRMFTEEYGQDFIRSGAGSIILVEP